MSFYNPSCPVIGCISHHDLKLTPIPCFSFLPVETTRLESLQHSRPSDCDDVTATSARHTPDLGMTMELRNASLLVSGQKFLPLAC